MGNVVSARSYDEAWPWVEKEKRDNFIFVSHEISSDWTWLARELNLSDADIKGIDADYEKQGAREKAYQALVKWFEENGRNGATKEVLCEALHAINKKAIAERICCSDQNNHKRSKNQRRCATCSEDDIDHKLIFEIRNKKQSPPTPSPDSEVNTKTESEDSELLLRCPSCGSCLNLALEILVKESEESIAEHSSDCVETSKAVPVVEKPDKCELRLPIPEDSGEIKRWDTKL